MFNLYTFIAKISFFLTSYFWWIQGFLKILHWFSTDSLKNITNYSSPQIVQISLNNKGKKKNNFHPFVIKWWGIAVVDASYVF